MNDEMVMRSVYLGLTEDSRLRQVAFEVGLNKSILIRSAIQKALSEWSQLANDEIVADVEASKSLSAEAAVEAPVAGVDETKAPRESLVAGGVFAPAREAERVGGGGS